MNFVESLKMFHVDSKEIPCLTAKGTPTASTEGAPGALYMDIDTGDLYKCTAADYVDKVYTWSPLVERSGSSGSSVNGNGLSTELNTAMVNYFTHVMPQFDDVNGMFYVNAILTALGAEAREGSSEDDKPDAPVAPEVTLTSISTTYSGGDVVAGTAVSALTGVVVTAHYSDGSTATVTGYTLSGTIAEGSNTVTVSYGGKTATFTVTGVVESGGGDSGEGVSSINYFIKTTSYGSENVNDTWVSNPAEPDDGYLLKFNSENDPACAWPLAPGKYKISIISEFTEAVYFSVRSATLDAMPVKGEIATITGKEVTAISGFTGVQPQQTMSWDYTAGSNEWMLVVPRAGNRLTITMEVAA